MPKANKYNANGTLKPVPQITDNPGIIRGIKAMQASQVRFTKAVSRMVVTFLVVATLVLGLLSVQGCSVNVIVAPHAVVAKDSLNERNANDTQNLRVDL